MTKKQADAEYWSFKPATSSVNAFVYSPVDSAGNPIEELAQVSDPPQGLTSECSDKRTILADLIKCVGGSLILSSKAASVFRRFRLGDGKFLPVTIVAGRRRDPIGNAEVLVSTTMDFCDLQRSTFVPISKGSKIPLYFTTPPVVIRDKLGGLDFVSGVHVFHACSNALREAILEAKLTNFEFEPLDVR
jgi:hypothetical protein